MLPPGLSRCWREEGALGVAAGAAGFGAVNRLVVADDTGLWGLM
jgi:hypothetical protein